MHMPRAGSGTVPHRAREDFRRLLAEMFDRGFPEDPFAR